jgi:hypothetical protein
MERTDLRRFRTKAKWKKFAGTGKSRGWHASVE